MSKGPRVLVVDDDADTREVTAAIIRSSGASVRTASSAADALEMLARETVDVIISDIAMPGVDGYALMRAVREREGPSRRAAALALSGHAYESDRALSLAAGFDLHLAKPVEMDMLLATLARLASIPRSAS